MKRALEFHDSTLAQVVVDGSLCVLKLRPAYIHESEGEPGVDVGRGFSQDIDLTFNGASVVGAMSVSPVDISIGTLSRPDGAELNMVELPLNLDQGIVLHLLTARDEKLRVTARSVRSAMVSEKRYVEKFGGTSNA